MTANRAASIRDWLKQHPETSGQDFNLTLTQYGLERLLYRLSISIRQRDADHYEVVDQVATAPGARTGLFMSSQSTLYVAVPKRGTAPAEIRVFQIQ